MSYDLVIRNGTVIDGSGQSTIDGETFNWSRGDVFVAPSWREHRHSTDSKAHLLRVSDEPVLERLHWLKRG